MLLTSFSYKTAGWELKKFESLASTCLLVGKNASGKTRTLRALQNVTRFLQNRKGTLFQENEFKTKLTFAKPSDPAWKMAYAFEVSDKKVVSEKLIVNGKIMIDRTSAVRYSRARLSILLRTNLSCMCVATKTSILK